jgi:hypothetical protein
VIADAFDLVGLELLVASARVLLVNHGEQHRC